MMSDQTFTIIIIAIIIDLIISGIAGIYNKSIYTHSMVLKILFIPLGIFGKVASNILSKRYAPEEGKLAVIASISCFAFAILLITFFIVRYIPENVSNILVPISLGSIIIGLPIIIFLYVRNN